MHSQALVVIHGKSYNNHFILIIDSTYKVGTMNIRLTIEDKYKNAIKVKNTNEINTLRLIKSAIKDKDIASRTTGNKDGIKDTEILSLLQSLIKQRKDSIEAFKVASRDDLILIEEGEIEIISKFLPDQMNENETEELILKIIKELNLVELKDMGKLMNEVKKNHAGTIDMALVGKIAKSKLG